MQIKPMRHPSKGTIGFHSEQENSICFQVISEANFLDRAKRSLALKTRELDAAEFLFMQ